MRDFSLFTVICLFPVLLSAQLSLGIESGLTFTEYNDVRVPNGNQEPGSLFSLKEDFESEQIAPFFRLELAYLINNRHTVELTAAPLQIDYENANLDAINFAGKDFSGTGIDGRYEFNTYRASYRYRLVDKEKLSFDLGASILVRDARIALRLGELMAEDTDLGWVPLISFELNYSPYQTVSFLLKGDALVGPQGRAEDVFAGALINLYQDQLQLKAGYRLIEGGADVEQVYNFAFIHFADLGLVYSF